jgi:type II secretory ATPase GspE/PulE/Tfp pilus assembly ATPase PilB-like protein
MPTTASDLGLHTSDVGIELAKGPSASVIKVVECLVESAFRARASDIHLDPEGGELKVRVRVDGALREVHTIPVHLREEVIARLKILSGLRTDEHQTPQDGRFRISLTEGAPIDVRVSIVPTYYGENAVLRLLAEQNDNYSLEALGFSAANCAKLQNAIQRPHGMILVTGPTGSGKTTTLYSLIRMLNTKERSIITIEDPVEYSIQGINQIQINSRTGLTFATGLRSVLRQDPNIIMVGEIRDAETAGLGVNAALTGHLVLSTLHTNDAPTTLPRLLDMKVEPYLISSTVNVVVAQRLVRRICVHCKVERDMSEAELKSLSEIVSASVLAVKPTLFAGKGCDKCAGTGYYGRLGLHEVIELDQPVRDAILSKASSNDIRTVAIERGMISMLNDGFEKAKAGHTTIEEILRISHE